MTPAALMREVRAAGADLALVDGKLKLRGPVSPELRAALREHKTEVAAILRGDSCRWCGERLAWPAAAGIIYESGEAECHQCGDAEVWRILAAADRVVNSPDALTDEAEAMLRGQIE